MVSTPACLLLPAQSMSEELPYRCSVDVRALQQQLRPEFGLSRRKGSGQDGGSRRRFGTAARKWLPLL